MDFFASQTLHPLNKISIRPCVQTNEGKLRAVNGFELLKSLLIKGYSVQTKSDMTISNQFVEMRGSFVSTLLNCTDPRFRSLAKRI